MNIKIITTEKKLSKSLINQMPTAGSFELKNGHTIGYVRKVVKNQNKTLLIKCYDNYFIFPSDYQKRLQNFYRNVGKWQYKFAFKSVESCDECWDYLQTRLAEAKTQIYI